jgi:hypothetical protein
MDQPDEIYVPTASVQRNVDFLRNLSSDTIWKNAPSTIRTKDQTASIQTTNPTIRTTHKSDTPPQPTQLNTPIRHGKSGGSTVFPMNTNQSLQPPTQTNREPLSPHARQPDDTTIATFTSTASTTLNSSYQATRFAELESSIKANQNTFKQMNTKYETMENRVLETMEACHENSKQLVTMQKQMCTMNTTIQEMAVQLSAITDHIMDKPNRSPVKKKLRQTGDLSNYAAALTCHQLDFDPVPTNTPDTPNPTSLIHADQEEAQYTKTSSPETAMNE